MSEEKWLEPLLTNHGKLSREAAKRRKTYEQISVPKGHVDELLNSGWKIDKELKIKTRLRRERNSDEVLENRVWLLFFLMGYPEISSGRNFKVRIDRKGAEPLYKQIDILSKDDETVIVTECKASERVRRRSLQKDIEKFSNLKGPIANAVKKHYGSSFKPKIIWLFITSNIVWSEPDKQRAAGENIRIITERELRYYLQISDHLKSAARFQFLAEFLKNQKIPGLEGVKVPAIRGKLGGRQFYCFVSTPKQMLKIAFVNHRSLNDPEGAPSYQRLVTRTRLKQISRFLREGGFFPTNILVNFTRKARFEQLAKDEEACVAFGHLYLPNRYRSAWVIDGQHRLYGFAPLNEMNLSQNIMVVAFEGLDKTEEANLFVTINHEQKTVPKTLLDDLEGELKWGSEIPTERIGAISARLIGLLNIDIGEPLYGRVTQQGIPATEKTCLGEFNVPKGTKDTVVFPDDDFTAISDYLQHCELYTQDFEVTLHNADSGDFVYVDPPYTVRHNNNNFIKYNEKIFRWEDQERLSNAVTRAADRGAFVLISNADYPCIHKLYSSDHWVRVVVGRHSILASDVMKRRRTTELVISNYLNENGEQGAIPARSNSPALAAGELGRYASK